MRLRVSLHDRTIRQRPGAYKSIQTRRIKSALNTHYFLTMGAAEEHCTYNDIPRILVSTNMRSLEY